MINSVCVTWDKSFLRSTTCHAMSAPTAHNPALLLDWYRFCSDAIVAFVRMQADVLRRLCPNHPVTVNLRALHQKFDHFDMARLWISSPLKAILRLKPYPQNRPATLTFSARSKNRTSKARRRLRLLVIEQKVGRSIAGRQLAGATRHHRLSTYQLISRGACGVFCHRWRQPRIAMKICGAVLPHHLEGNTRVFKEISQIGEELKILAPRSKTQKSRPRFASLQP